MNDKTIVLDEYEKELEGGLTAKDFLKEDEESKRITLMIKEWAASQRKQKVTFTSTKSTFELFKVKAKAMNMPYSTLLNALMELYNRGEIGIIE